MPLTTAFSWLVNKIFQNVILKISISCYDLRVLKTDACHMKGQTKYSWHISVRRLLRFHRILEHDLMPILLLYSILNAYGKQ